MNHPAPKFDGSVRMTHADINGAIKARIIHLVTSGEMTEAQVARYYGFSPQRVSEMLAPGKPEKPEKKATVYTRVHNSPERLEVLRLADRAQSMAELERLSGRGTSFVRTTLLLMAPDVFERFKRKGKGKSSSAKASSVAEIDWSERGKEYVTHPKDKWLAESLARAASFVATTKDGVTVRLVPPRSEGAAA